MCHISSQAILTSCDMYEHSLWINEAYKRSLVCKSNRNNSNLKEKLKTCVVLTVQLAEVPARAAAIGF